MNRKVKKTRVLFVGPLPPPYSGPELSMHQFLNSQILNENLKIFFLKTNFRQKNENKGKFGYGMIINFFSFFFQLIYLIISKRPKLVYYPVTPTQIGWIGRDALTILISKFFGCKVVIHLRGSHFKLNFQNFSNFAKKLVNFSLKRVDTAIVQAAYLKDQFLPQIPEKNIHVLYQSIDVDEFKFAPIEHRIRGKILVVGHLTKAKGFTDIVKIIPDVCSQFPYVKFYFAGEMRKGERGVFYNQVTGEKIQYEDPFEVEESLLNSQYKDNYIKLGIISGEDKIKQFSTSSLFLTTSYSEGFSRALLEAMSTGLPLVYSPVGAHREVLSDENGISVTPGNLDEIKNVIVRMLSKDNNAYYSINNRKQAEDNFNVESICGNFYKILNITINNEKNN